MELSDYIEDDFRFVYGVKFYVFYGKFCDLMKKWLFLKFVGIVRMMYEIVDWLIKNLVKI